MKEARKEKRKEASKTKTRYDKPNYRKAVAFFLRCEEGDFVKVGKKDTLYRFKGKKEGVILQVLTEGGRKRRRILPTHFTRFSFEGKTYYIRNLGEGSEEYKILKKRGVI